MSRNPDDVEGMTYEQYLAKYFGYQRTATTEVRLREEREAAQRAQQRRYREELTQEMRNWQMPQARYITFDDDTITEAAPTVQYNTGTNYYTASYSLGAIFKEPYEDKPKKKKRKSHLPDWW